MESPAQLLNIGVNTAATFGYCNCDYLAYEVIAQDYALSVGWTMSQFWINLVSHHDRRHWRGRGRLVCSGFSRDWMILSYFIALRTTRLASSSRYLNLGQVSSPLVVGVVSGFAVPIWAFLLARGTRQPEPESVAA